MLDVDDPAPDFYLPAADDPSAEYMLSAAADAGPVVLAFVPDSTGDARSLLETLAAIQWADLADRISVFGIAVSPDQSLATDLPFPVLQDGNGYVSNLYEVAARADGNGPRQAIVLADQGCTIRFAWQAADPTEDPPLDRFRSAVADVS